MIDADELRARSESFLWYHSIDLGQGVVTKGLSEGPYIPEKALPDLQGKSVLDIGAWDGYYSFMAERLGAAQVMALDHYVWGVDIPARERYWAECRDQGVLPDHTKDTTDFWDAALPGRRGLELAKEALDSKVEPMLADFMTVDLASVGTFDVVFYLGVLYHMKEPLTALERVRAVTKDVAVVETAGIHIPELKDASLLQFHAADQLNRDYGNWFAPTAEALRSLCLAAGFSRVELAVGPPIASATTPDLPTLEQRLRRAASVLLGRTSTGPGATTPTVQSYRVVVRAYV